MGLEVKKLLEREELKSWSKVRCVGRKFWKGFWGLGEVGGVSVKPDGTLGELNGSCDPIWSPGMFRLNPGNWNCGNVRHRPTTPITSTTTTTFILITDSDAHLTASPSIYIPKATRFDCHGNCSLACLLTYLFVCSTCACFGKNVHHCQQREQRKQQEKFSAKCGEAASWKENVFASPLPQLLKQVFSSTMLSLWRGLFFE